MLFNFKKHRKLFMGCIVVIILVTLLGAWQRRQYMKNPYENQLGNPARGGEACAGTFYEEQLTEKEARALEALTQAARSMEGGEFVFPEPLTGSEYTRVSAAFSYGSADCFYALADVPMTEDGRNVNYVDKDILNMEEASIAKCLLFLYPAEGLDVTGELDENGYVTNLDALREPLAAMDEERTAYVKELQEKTEELLAGAVAAMPTEYGTKEAVDYFLGWLDENLTLDTEIMQDTSGVTTMSEVFEKVYFENGLSCAALGKAGAAGYTKTLVSLCNRAGIPAHVVIGSWKNGEGYTLACVSFGEENVYIDASGYRSKDLWGQRYISETNAARQMTFASYFMY